MAKIIKVDGSVVNTEPKNGTNFVLEELKSIVGGWVEVVKLNERQLMVVNDEGKFEELEVNTKATNILRENISTCDYIVGDVLICDVGQIK